MAVKTVCVCVCVCVLYEGAIARNQQASVGRRSYDHRSSQLLVAGDQLEFRRTRSSRREVSVFAGHHAADARRSHVGYTQVIIHQSPQTTRHCHGYLLSQCTFCRVSLSTRCSFTFDLTTGRISRYRPIL